MVSRGWAIASPFVFDSVASTDDDESVPNPRLNREPTIGITRQMPLLPEARDGIELKAYSRTVPFSFWPTAPTVPRPTLQSLLFAADPWGMMRRAITEQVASPASRQEAHSYIDQARDFFVSAKSSPIDGAKPVQLYYSFLNLAKAFTICRGIHPSLPNIMHGLSEALPAGGREFDDALIKFWPSLNEKGQLQAFDEFMAALGVERIAAGGLQIPVSLLIPQILSGHRLWASAVGSSERFISLHDVQFYQNRRRRQVWLRVLLFADDVKRLGFTQNDVLNHSGLAANFRKVRCNLGVSGRSLICFEQMVPINYGRHGVDHASELATSIKDQIWMTVGSSAPFRRHYLYLVPPADRLQALPQIASIYATAFYFGSITRYRPNVLRSALEGPLGPRISEFISGQPSQFVYLMASEFAKRDVTKPSIV